MVVQEDTLGEARQVETDSASFLDQMSRYYSVRAKVCSKIAKYPHLVSVHTMYFVKLCATG